MCVMAVPRETR